MDNAVYIISIMWNSISGLTRDNISGITSAWCGCQGEKSSKNLRNIGPNITCIIEPNAILDPILELDELDKLDEIPAPNLI